MKTIGQNIARFRKQKGITQEQLAEICNVSPQAVSKWENDNSCPDVTLLKLLARTFGVSVDELLDDGEGPITKLAEVDGAKAKLLKIRVLSNEGHKVNVNLPVALFELLLTNNEIKDKIKIGNSKTFDSIDFEEIMRLVSLGVMGKLVEIEGADGDTVEIWVE